MAEDYATKADIGELKAEVGQLKTEVGQLKTELGQLRTDVGQDIAQVRIEMLERLEHVETTLLREFHKWAIPTNSRFRVSEITSAALLERMTLAEERITNLEINSKR